ncbi:MAG TPA: hypothetical protein VHB77_20690, partial [Planctomycetaceae bacterium]|nr:hypothetical protein [Planctomycetaceae bacterium]
MPLSPAESLKLLVCEPESNRPSRRLLASLLLWVFVDVIALVLLARRLAGAFPLHLSVFDFSWILALGTILSCLARGLMHRDEESLPRPLWRILLCLAPVVALSFALWPGRSVGAIGTALVAWTVTAIVAARPALVFGEGWLEQLGGMFVEFSRFLSDALPGSTPAVEPSAEEFDASEQAGVRLERRTTAAGIEEIDGSAVARFAAGQKHCTVHVAFCPPFGARPAVELAVGSGLDAQVKAAAVYPYGVRIDVRRSGDAAEA